MARCDTANCNRSALLLALVLAAALAGDALAMSQSSVAPSPSEPANFVQWRAGLASSAQPDAIYLARVKVLDYGIVINLAPPQSL
ncbi:MAG: hypothetical protein ABWZ29_09775 [Casimicrobiaceae bacterium]